MPSRSATPIQPARRLRGRLRVPGDKSISHRYAILAALASGPSTLLNYSPGADCQSTSTLLQALGVQIRTSQSGANPAITVMGRGLGRLRSPAGPLDAGNSGTTMRLMAGVLAGQPFASTLVGDESLSRRPMRRIVEPLQQMGAAITSTDGHAPLVIRGTQLNGIAYVPTVPSAQVKSAVLLAGLHADGVTTVTESSQTRDHTERALRAFGGRVDISGMAVSVTGPQRLHGRDLSIPGDLSSAAYWLIAAAGLPGSRVEIEDVGLNSTRTAILDVLRRFGARVVVEADTAADEEPHGRVVVEHDGLSDLTIAAEEVPALIDELPGLAALAAYGSTVAVSGAGELRVKESDRIASLVAGFRALGLEADERPDGFVVGPKRRGAGSSTRSANACGDHRLAMAFAIAAIGASGRSRIEGAGTVAISYPGFFETLARLADFPVELDV
jgi:3-phosphoshikimate 1-carboxyvinyltransferase